MKAVSIFDLRDNLADYLASVKRTETPLIVSRFGKPIAVITPFSKETVSFEKYFGFMGKGDTGEAFLKRVRRSKHEARANKIRRGKA